MPDGAACRPHPQPLSATSAPVRRASCVPVPTCGTCNYVSWQHVEHAQQIQWGRAKKWSADGGSRQSRAASRGGRAPNVWRHSSRQQFAEHQKRQRVIRQWDTEWSSEEGHGVGSIRVLCVLRHSCLWRTGKFAHRVPTALLQTMGLRVTVPARQRATAGRSGVTGRSAVHLHLHRLQRCYTCSRAS